MLQKLWEAEHSQIFLAALRVSRNEVEKLRGREIECIKLRLKLHLFWHPVVWEANHCEISDVAMAFPDQVIRRERGEHGMLISQTFLEAKAEEEIKRRLMLHNELVWHGLMSVPHFHLDLISKNIKLNLHQGYGAANSFLPLPVFFAVYGRFFVVTSSGICFRVV